MASTLAVMSSRGQIVLPKAVRKKFNLGEGSQFFVIYDDENIYLRPVKEPTLEEIYAQLEKTRKVAQEMGITEDDIAAEIKALRAEKKR